MKQLKPWHISLFIFSVIGVLACIAAAYPEDGITIGETTLRFPTLQSYWQWDNQSEQPTSEPELSPEELLALRAAEAHNAEGTGVIHYFQTNPSRIHWPYEDSCSIGDSTYFDQLYTALRNATDTSVHIVHYGDSQIEEDRITQILRRQLQERFGGGGAGLIPLYQSIATATIGQHTNIEPTRYLVYGNQVYRRNKSNKYGPMGQVAIVDTTITCSVTPRSKQTGIYSAHYFNQLTLLYSTNSSMNLTAKGRTTRLTPSKEPMQCTTIALPDSTTSINIRLSGNGEVYGILLEQDRGVGVDNIPMRGCSGLIFTGIQAAQLNKYFSTTHTKLIILQYGGNTIPHLSSEERVDKYIASLVWQIRYLQQQAPDAAILFIGPSDMTTRRKGVLQTYRLLPYMEQTLCREVTQAGAAYWSIYNSMGGENSMQQWVKAGLAGNDYVHFTRKGAENIGNMLCDAFFNGYKFYQWRNNIDD